MTADAENEAFAARCWRQLAHLRYRAGPEGLLRRGGAPQGGLMVLTDAGGTAFPPAEPLCGEVAAECAARGFSGAAADFEGRASEERAAFLRALAARLRETGRTLFVPEEYAAAVPESRVLFCTAMSGGVFEARLRRAAERVGAGRLALDLQWLRMEFPLPCPSGRGRLLSAEALEALRRELAPAVFFSPELCADYFTFRRGQEHRLVLFDSPETLVKKLRLAKRLGCPDAFLLCAEAGDALPELLARIRKEKVL